MVPRQCSRHARYSRDIELLYEDPLEANHRFRINNQPLGSYALPDVVR